MSLWDDHPVGMWQLYQFNQKGSGLTTHLGYYPTFRAAVEAARAIAPISKLEGEFSATFKRSNDRQGASVDGYSQRIDVATTGTYDPHVEIVLPDGKKIWLEDLLAKIESAVAA